MPNREMISLWARSQSWSCILLDILPASALRAELGASPAALAARRFTRRERRRESCTGSRPPGPRTNK